MKNRILQGSALLVAAALSMTACSSTSTDDPSAGASASASQSAADERVMQDSLGDVVVPFEAQRIATTAPAFTTAVLLLGGSDKLVALEENYGKNEWIKEKYPQLADLPVVFAGNETNMEELLNQDPDLVLYAARYGEDTLKQLQDLDIAAVSGAKDSDAPGYDHLNWVRDNQLYFGEAIGGAQLENAKKYGDQFTETRAAIAEKTDDLPEADRPTVVQLSAAGETLQANNGSAIGQEMIELGGGINAAADADGESMGPSGQTKIEAEQLLSWNPDILLVDSQEISDAVTSDPILSELDAVKSGRIHIVPNGAMAWAYNGPEAYLAMQFFAKAIQPELFTDLDIQKNTEDFYKTYFGFELDDADLAHLFNLEDGQKVADVFAK